jgi:hypothetical protein
MPTLSEKRDSRVGVSDNRYNDTCSKMEKFVKFVLCSVKFVLCGKIR